MTINENARTMISELTFKLKPQDQRKSEIGKREWTEEIKVEMPMEYSQKRSLIV